MSAADSLVPLAWFVSTVLFVVGLKRMSSPRRARSGILWAGAGMLLGVSASLLQPSFLEHAALTLLALFLGGGWAFWQSRRAPMSAMPALIALYIALGATAAAAIAIVAVLHPQVAEPVTNVLAVLGALLGSVTMAGAFMAYLRLRGGVARRHRFANRQVTYLTAAAGLLLLGLILAASTTAHPVLLLLFIALSLTFGVLMTLPIASNDMLVLVSLYNAMTGLAVGLDGYLLSNPAMMVAGTLVFAAGTLLTRKMARSRNRRLSEIMYSGFGITSDERAMPSRVDQPRTIDALDAATSMAYANRVVVVPGYGMAVSQAQHKLRELTQMLEERGVEIAFAIHPMAGRMPGHMNVALAEAGVPYSLIHDLTEVAGRFSDADVALVVGANDIVNADAQQDETSPLFGMPIMPVADAGRVIALKRDDGKGYASVENNLFHKGNAYLVFGDARASIQRLIDALKSLDI